MKIYQVSARRDGKFWLLTIAELDVMTPARRLTEAEEMTRDLIATWLQVEPESFALTIDVIPPNNLDERRDRARQMRQEADLLREAAAEERRHVARGAYDAGMSVRELAIVLGVPHQRAQQILAETHGQRVA